MTHCMQNDKTTYYLRKHESADFPVSISHYKIPLKSYNVVSHIPRDWQGLTFLASESLKMKDQEWVTIESPIKNIVSVVRQVGL